MPDNVDETSAQLLVEDFSSALENVTGRPLEGCDACRACAIWQLRNKNSLNSAEGNNR